VALDEIDIARLIAALPSAPEGWVRAAELLPFATHDLDELAARCSRDAELRAQVLAGLEAALASSHPETRRAAGELDARLREG
jgi:hypothetical protein